MTGTAKKVCAKKKERGKSVALVKRKCSSKKKGGKSRK